MADIIQGDEVGILLEFLYARLRGNGSGFDVDEFEHTPDQQYPCYGFSIQENGSANEQGGGVLYSSFMVNIFAISTPGAADISEIRAAAKEIPELVFVDSTTPMTDFADGRVIYSVQQTPLRMAPATEHGQKQQYLGSRWEMRVQPDGAHH